MNGFKLTSNAKNVNDLIDLPKKIIIVWNMQSLKNKDRISSA